MGRLREDMKLYKLVDMHGGALKLLDGGGKGGRGESKYREIAWKLEERGAMGETIIGICLLQGTDVHNKLAMKIIEAFPKLINDINISEDFYGM
ncbi:hypothetical protein TELCIR_12146 [Teladorsagia circumcincta]|uniref:Uncharacterized protein n=1 Tax=Teladorsagia circumcincta TaxID=45464 RepID=A0A2G9U8V5_TELCI|nr:hypothetical protein TELCIR_12146 [Teladorsagia circumcincta]